ncbi:MAG: quinone-dependent dihydroorotate dehydrogenase [Bacteroidetes bacterium]|nr:MAG: quinone-dependent dihydroorotate dehydrogenase [Bacteroidota bacterium]
MYSILRTILFWFDAEKVHHFSMRMLHLASSVGWLRSLLARQYAAKAKPTTFCGLQFANPIGLAAGFDKNAAHLNQLALLAFGHIEIGTVTPQPQQGNPTPRLFRLPEDKALINRMGFNNDGVEAIAQRLRQYRASTQHSSLIIGGNIGKNKDTPNAYAYMDYDKCFRALHPVVDYFVVNVSSPNTPGLRQLQEKPALQHILTHLQGINSSQPVQRPLLLKIAPDLTNEQLLEVVDLAMEIQLDGLVVANTSLDRSHLSDAGKIRAGEAGNGGLSGKPAGQRSTEMIRLVSSRTQGKLPIMASGGIFTAADAQEKIAAGATLLQVWTGFVYQGPAIVKQICNGI